MIDSEFPLTSPDCLDWNSVWKTRMAEWKKCNSANCGGYWRDRDAALRYVESVNQGSDRLQPLLRDLAVEAGHRVLDIGSGPGVCSLPLARVASEVCAVDPSPGMIDVLREQAESQGLTNISPVCKRWEEVDPASDLDGEYDVILASMSLGMPDIREALVKMMRVARGTVHLVWAADKPSWEDLPEKVWPLLHGREYAPPPRAGVILNVLWDMGVFPDVRTKVHHHSEWYADLDDAEEFFAERYGAKDDRGRDIVRDGLRELLVPDGSRMVLRYTLRCMHIRWDAREYPPAA